MAVLGTKHFVAASKIGMNALQNAEVLLISAPIIASEISSPFSSLAKLPQVYHCSSRTVDSL